MQEINNYILGGGPAGLITAFYNSDYVILDKNPMGQLNLPFVPGPRILKVDKYSQKFIDKLGIKYTKKIINIGYTDNDQDIVDIASENFRRTYSEITRGTSIIEDSFLSSGENQIEIFYHSDYDIYFKIFEILTEKLKDRILPYQVDYINTKRQTITHTGITSPYIKLISTLNLNILCNILRLESLNLPTGKKHFVQCSYNNLHDIELSKKYAYIYSTNQEYTRKTYFKDYIVYEMLFPFDEQNRNFNIISGENVIFDLSQIEGNKVIKALNNIPIQINNSFDFRNIQGIELVGRFAQWNHSIKANEIIQKYE